MASQDTPRAGGVFWLLLVLIPLIVLTVLWKEFREPAAAALSIVVGAATIAYAVLTSRLVNSTDAMRRAQERATALAAESIELQTRPNILVFVRPHRTLLYLIVENVGAGEAFDVKLRVEGNLEEAPDQLISEARFITEGFRYLAPKQWHGALLANMARPFRHAAGEITVTYRSRAGVPYERSFPIYLEDLYGTGVLDSHLPDERMADSIEKIAKKLGAQ